MLDHRLIRRRIVTPLNPFKFYVLEKPSFRLGFFCALDLGLGLGSWV